MAPDGPPKTTTSSEEFLVRFLPGTSKSTSELRHLVERLNAARNRNLVRVVLLVGESGSGKNHLARVLAGHRRWLEVMNSKDSLGLEAGLGAFTEFFGEINLPALPEPLIESELFGYRKNAFTDAKEDRPGLLGGPGSDKELEFKDVLLDEIGDASPALQSKLLQVVEQGRCRPVGGGPDSFYETSARLIMATNRDLGSLVKQGRFREDLYWRLREFVVTVPPLRGQPENIPEIAQQLLGDLQKDRVGGIDNILTLSPDELAWARGYEWPGNVRELRHALVRWLFGEGRVPLPEVVRQTHDEDREATPAAEIASLVRRRLEEALAGKSAPPGTLNALPAECASLAKEAISAWYRATSPSDEQLKALFPDAKLDSIRNKLSQWRKI